MPPVSCLVSSYTTIWCAQYIYHRIIHQFFNSRIWSKSSNSIFIRNRWILACYFCNKNNHRCCWNCNLLGTEYSCTCGRCVDNFFCGDKQLHSILFFCPLISWPTCGHFILKNKSGGSGELPQNFKSKVSHDCACGNATRRAPPNPIRQGMIICGAIAFFAYKIFCFSPITRHGHFLDLLLTFPTNNNYPIFECRGKSHRPPSDLF